MTDLNIKKIKSIGNCGQRVLLNIQDIYCRDDILYVCDYGNKCLHILNIDLDVLTTIDLDYCPWKVRVSSTAICINSSSGTFFYSLKDNYKILHQYNNRGCCRISEINSHFYEFVSGMKKFNCYNIDGVLLDEIFTDRFDHYISSPLDGCLLYLNNNLFMTFEKKKHILKFF
jgi:hypothetical protein